MRHLLLLLLVSPLAAQQREIRGFRANPDVALRLWVPAGYVEVEAWDRDSVEVRATPGKGTRVVGGGTAAGGKYALEGIVPSDSVLPSAQLRVYVPRRAKLWIKSTTASVHVRGTRGELDVLQVTGDSHVEGASGVVTIESIDGIARIGNVVGTLRIRGGGGDVTIGGIDGTLDVSLISGNLMFGASRTGSAAPLQGRAETVGGRIVFTGNLPPRSRLELVTHDGPIMLMLVGESPPRLENHVERGGLNIVGTPAADAGLLIVRSFKGTLNGGYSPGI